MIAVMVCGFGAKSADLKLRRRDERPRSGVRNRRRNAGSSTSFARQLQERSYEVRSLSRSRATDMKGRAATSYSALRNLSGCLTASGSRSDQSLTAIDCIWQVIIGFFNSTQRRWSSRSSRSRHVSKVERTSDGFAPSSAKRQLKITRASHRASDHGVRARCCAELVPGISALGQRKTRRVAAAKVPTRVWTEEEESTETRETGERTSHSALVCKRGPTTACALSICSIAETQSRALHS